MKKLLFGIVSLFSTIAFAQPQISSISPTTGPAGTSVTITGSGFNPIADSNWVYFNDTILATVTSASSSSLTVIVPITSSNGPVKVINHRYSHIDFSDQYYTYPALASSPPPIISSYFPLQAQAGDVLTINGSNFSTIPGNNSVHFGSVKAQVISSNTTQINVYVPAGLKYDYISVTVDRQTCYSDLPFEVTFPVVDSSIVGSSFSNGVIFSNTCGMSPYSRGFIDVDGDGKQDLCNANYGCFSISRNTSTFDNFSFAPPVYTSAGGASADIDGDGKLDFISSSPNSFLVSKNTSSIGNISFRPSKAFYTTGIPKRAVDGYGGPVSGIPEVWCGVSDSDTLVDPTNISTGDIDGDGKPDLAVSFAANCLNGFYAFYRNTTNNGVIDFSFALTLNGTSLSTALKDLDGDGRPDVIASLPGSRLFSGSGSGSGFFINRNTSTPGNISFAPRVILEMGRGDFSLADINNDGKLDIIMTVESSSQNTFQVSLNQSTVGNISFAPPVSFLTLESPHVAISDLDGDGKPDAAVFHYPTPHVHTYITIFKNNTVGTTVSFDSVSQILVKDDLVVPGAGIITCDVDMDGKPEIIAQYSSDQYSIYRNKANEPSIDSLADPSSHLPLPAGTKQVVIKGDRFLGATSVTFNGVSANSFIINAKDQITAIVDTVAAATMKVRVESPLGIATLPVGSIYAPLANFCTSGSASIIFKADNGIPPYKFQYKINNGIINTVTSGPGDSVIVIKSSATATTYTYSLINVTDLYGNGSKNSMNKTAVIRAVTVPSTPGVITGPTNVCSYMGASTNATYSIATVATANSYNWTVPVGATIVSGQGTTSINVSYSTSFVSGSIGVQSVSGCTSIFKTLAITKTLPTLPGTITGTTNVCSYVGTATNVTYSIASVATATSYYWTTPTGATIVSGQGTTSISVNFTSGFVPGNISVQSVSGCGSSAFKTLALTAPLPTLPGIITGTANVCSYVGTATNLTYSIAPITTATSYYWTVPTGAAIVSGQGTTSVSVNFTSGFTPGNIAVQSVTNCGNSAFKTLALTGPLPTLPGVITGPAAVCSYMGSATNAVYSIVPVATAVSYNWTVPTGATIVSGAGTTNINVSYSSSFVSGNISVQSVSGCGNSAAKTLAITKTIPVAPTAITGPAGVCAFVGSSTNATYTITAVTGAVSYYWTVPSGATIVTGQGTASIDVSYATSFVSGNISVQSVSGCGSSAFKSLAISKTLPAAPASITGPASVCSFMGSSTNATYTAATVSGATSYNWTVPSGASIVSGQGTIGINVSYTTGFVSGNISVQSVTICGSSTFKTLAITKVIPAVPGTITGPIAVCSYMGSATNAAYSITAVLNANSYNWVVPTGATIVSGAGTTNISVSYSTSFVSGNVTVQSVSGCGSSIAKTLAITKTLPTAPLTLTGPTNACSYMGSTTNATYSTGAVATAVSYNWTVPTGATIVSGQGTTSINVSYTSSFVSGNVTVQSVSGCGNSAAKTLTITKTIPTAPVAITGTTNVCNYFGTSTNLTYSIAAVTGADSYNWTAPANATIISGQGTASIDVNYSSSFVSGNISVQSVSGCGSSIAKTSAITKTVPAIPGLVTGPLYLCNYLNTDTTYTILPVAEATSYTWTVPTGITLLSGQGTTSIAVHISSTFVSGNITVISNSNCGSSTARTIVLKKSPPSTGPISGPVSICALTSATYSVAPVTEAVSYIWLIPKGISPVPATTGTISTNTTTGITTVSGTTKSIDLTIDTSIVTTSAATIKVAAVNSCSLQGTYQLLALTACRTSDYITNITSSDTKNLLNIYPNPSNDFFNLDISLLSDSEILLEIFDVAGQSVIKKEYLLNKGMNSVITNVSELKAGTYFLKITSNDSSVKKSKVFIKE
jgi:hypothetical protein